MSYFGDIRIGRMPLGEVEIAKAFLGSDLVFQKGGVTPPIPSRLPDGYTEVEYIENTSTARINTGISGISQWTLVAQLITPGTGNSVLIGRNTGGGHFFTSMGAYSNWWGAGSDIGQYVEVSALNKTTIELNFSSLKVINGTINGETFTRTATANSTLNYFLFNATTNSSYPFRGRLFGDVVCMQNNVEVFRGVPCTDPNGVAGLYDLVGNSFIGSSNSATFSAGPAIN